MDRARQKTDKILSDLERRIDSIYESDPSLKRIQKKYARYMQSVEAKTKDAYLAYQNADASDRDRLKRAYAEEVELLTLRNKTYRGIVKEFSRIMADVNQEALDLVNEEMSTIYAINYNQIAVDCRKIGITVNGEADI